jgi:murein DD-endopeptidase MepM/ murein hydrolase activator NlpD
MSYQNLDFKSGQAPYKPGRRGFFQRLSLKGVGMSVALVGALYLILSFQPDSVAKVDDSNLKADRLHYPVDLPQSASIDTLPETSAPSVVSDEPEQVDWQDFEVKSGDTLAAIFDRAGLSAATTHKVANLNDLTKKLTRIKPGESISLLLDDDKNLVRLRYRPDITRTLLVQTLEDGKLSSEMQHHPLEPMPVYRSGVIESSLFEAASANDISENIIMEMAAIFGWDIDFSLDLRKGDEFGIVFNELYKDGKKIKDGDILAAEFINQGKLYQAVRYTDPRGESGYFSPDGKSMRKAFLRSPVEFSRISSRFTNKRWHPVLSKWRSHKGVDYAAPRGTPIRASGDGKITFRGTKGGYGKTIFLQHGSAYTTVYAHLNSFARGATNGKRVKQGQIIGYVGSTGLASGPHLHYEFRVNGVHRNPLTVKLPDAEPIDKAYAGHFKKHTKSFLSMLRLMNDKALASLSQE